MNPEIYLSCDLGLERRTLDPEIAGWDSPVYHVNYTCTQTW